LAARSAYVSVFVEGVVVDLKDLPAACCLRRQIDAITGILGIVVKHVVEDVQLRASIHVGIDHLRSEIIAEYVVVE
jgi:hypothetical protein